MEMNTSDTGIVWLERHLCLGLYTVLIKAPPIQYEPYTS